MARVRSPARDKAFEIYKENKGNIDLVKIAEILSISPGTVRGWKAKDKWSDKINGTLQKNKERSNKKINNKKNNSKKEAVADEVLEVIENTDLTDKQKLFCIFYTKTFNATKAYLKAYKCTYETAAVNANRLLKNTKINDQINSLLASELNKEFLTRGLIQKYMDIAFSDIGDYIKFGKKTERAWGVDEEGNPKPIIDPETGEQKEYQYNYIDLKESTMVDTTLISEVSQGKDGIKFKLLDKMKAMDFLTKHCNLLNDEEKTKLEIENRKLQNIKLETEIKRIKASIDEDSELENEDDGFIEALGSKVAEVWIDEEDS